MFHQPYNWTRSLLSLLSRKSWAKPHEGHRQEGNLIREVIFGANDGFVSNVALVGALVLSRESDLQNMIAFFAVTFASINVFGGYLVTNRMLKMFKKK